MKKTIEILIKDYKKSNKERRKVLAKRAGFYNVEDYLKDLETKYKRRRNKKDANDIIRSKMKGIFYVFDILDASASMYSDKYENSKEGIIAGIKDMTTRNDVKYSLVEFIEAKKGLNRAITQEEPSKIDLGAIKFSGAVGNDTPLYYTVYTVINELRVNKEDKVLINVYTDGLNNSKYEYVTLAAELIKKVQKENVTVTFVATPSDLIKIKKDINITDSNTLPTENTAYGFKMSMEKTRSAKLNYFAKADAREDTLVGFYKQEGKL